MVERACHCKCSSARKRTTATARLRFDAAPGANVGVVVGASDTVKSDSILRRLPSTLLLPETLLAEDATESAWPTTDSSRSLVDNGPTEPTSELALDFAVRATAFLKKRSIDAMRGEA